MPLKNKYLWVFLMLAALAFELFMIAGIVVNIVIMEVFFVEALTPVTLGGFLVYFAWEARPKNIFRKGRYD